MPIKSIDQILYHTKNKIIKILDTKKITRKDNIIYFNK